MVSLAISGTGIRPSPAYSSPICFCSPKPKSFISSPSSFSLIFHLHHHFKFLLPPRFSQPHHGHLPLLGLQLNEPILHCICRHSVLPINHHSHLRLSLSPQQHPSSCCFRLLLSIITIYQSPCWVFPPFRCRFAAAAVTGELKAIAVLGFGGNGEAVAAALLYRGSSPLPCQTITTQSPSFWLSSSHRGPPYFILFGSHLQVSTCKCFNLKLAFVLVLVLDC